MMGWQWHQLDHMQIICTSLQHLITQFLRGQMLFLQLIQQCHLLYECHLKVLYVFVQLYDERGDKIGARTKLVDIVHVAGEVGFRSLVEALMKTNQKDLARKLDEELSRQFTVRQPDVASMCRY